MPAGEIVCKRRASNPHTAPTRYSHGVLGVLEEVHILHVLHDVIP